MTVLGINLLVGGLLMTTIMVGEPNVTPLFISQPITASTAMGLIFALAGLLSGHGGFALVLYHSWRMSWYVGETEKSSVYSKKMIGGKTEES